MFFGILFLLLAALSVFGICCLSKRICRYPLIKKLGRKGRILSLVLPIAFSVLLALVANGFNAIIIILHLITALLLCILSGIIISAVTKRPRKYFAEDISAVLITAVYLFAGWFLANHVFETTYEFTTEKDLGALRVVQISDSHLGVTMDGKEFGEQIEKIQGTNPDVVVITGDFVDDDSLKEDMIIACEALGELKTTYGVYFIFDNHDEGYFNSRNFTVNELRENLEANEVKILEDETVLIDERFYIVGRKDRSAEEREDMLSLVAELDKSKYMIVLDHQPNDYAAESEANVDLVLSGHTHGGHIWPAGMIGVLIGSNDRAYGTETRGNTDFVVSSGLSGWAIPFKTGTISEYVVIDIN